jgi:hypothetical protein
VIDAATDACNCWRDRLTGLHHFELRLQFDLQAITEMCFDQLYHRLC